MHGRKHAGDRLTRHGSVPGVRVPRLFHGAEQLGDLLRVLALDVIATIVKNVEDGTVIQAQEVAGIEGESLPDGNDDSSGGEKCFSLL